MKYLIALLTLLCTMSLAHAVDEVCEYPTDATWSPLVTLASDASFKCHGSTFTKTGVGSRAYMLSHNPCRDMVLCQDFEQKGYYGSGMFDHGETWNTTATGAASTSTNTTTPLVGGSSIQFDGGASAGWTAMSGTYYPDDGSDLNSHYGYVRIKPVLLGTHPYFYILPTNAVKIYIDSDTAKWGISEGASASLSDVVAVQGTEQHIWWDYTAVSESSPYPYVMSIYVSETSTKPGSPTATLSGDKGTGYSAGKSYIQMTIGYTTGESQTILLIDKLRISESEIKNEGRVY